MHGLSRTETKAEKELTATIDWRSRTLPAASQPSCPPTIIIPYLLQTCAYLLLNFLFIANLLK
jgi:hypothetical protein